MDGFDKEMTFDERVELVLDAVISEVEQHTLEMLPDVVLLA